MADGVPVRTLTPHGLRVALGRRLAKLRLSRNVTQRALAADAGIGLRTLRNVEAGHSCSLDSFLRLAMALGVAEGLLSAVPSAEIRPIERVDFGGRERRRASSRRRQPPERPWSWGEETYD